MDFDKFDQNVMAHYALQLEQSMGHERNKHGARIITACAFDRALIEFMQYTHESLTAAQAYFGLAVYIRGVFDGARTNADMKIIKPLVECLEQVVFHTCNELGTPPVQELPEFEWQLIEHMLGKLEQMQISGRSSKSCEFERLLIERAQYAHARLPTSNAHAVIATFVRGILESHGVVSYGDPS
jgi:hypothetical protein